MHKVCEWRLMRARPTMLCIHLHVVIIIIYNWGEPEQAPYWSNCVPTVYMCIYNCWGKPEWAPHWSCMPAENMRGKIMWISIIHPRLSRWFPRSVYAMKCSVNSGILTWSSAWFTTEQQLIGCCKNYGWRHNVNAQTHDINGFSLPRDWSCSCPETMTDGLWTVLLVCAWHSY